MNDFDSERPNIQPFTVKYVHHKLIFQLVELRSFGEPCKRKKVSKHVLRIIRNERNSPTKTRQFPSRWLVNTKHRILSNLQNLTTQRCTMVNLNRGYPGGSQWDEQENVTWFDAWSKFLDIKWEAFGQRTASRQAVKLEFVNSLYFQEQAEFVTEVEVTG